MFVIATQNHNTLLKKLFAMSSLICDEILLTKTEPEIYTEDGDVDYLKDDQVQPVVRPKECTLINSNDL